MVGLSQNGRFRGGVQASAENVNKEWGILKNVKTSVSFFMDSPQLLYINRNVAIQGHRLCIHLLLADPVLTMYYFIDCHAKNYNGCVTDARYNSHFFSVGIQLKYAPKPAQQSVISV